MKRVKIGEQEKGDNSRAMSLSKGEIREPTAPSENWL